MALDRAFELASAHPDALRGLAFLMDWPALREASALIFARPGEVRGGHEAIPLWASRLSGRHPAAAALLIRARARALVTLGSDGAEELQGLIAEAEALAALAGDDAPIPDHPAFVAEIEALGDAAPASLVALMKRPRSEGPGVAGHQGPLRRP